MSGRRPCRSDPTGPCHRTAHLRRPRSAATALIIAGLLVGCASGPPGGPPAPVVQPSGTTSTTPDGRLAWSRGKARWVSARWDELPGWGTDAVAQAWGALWRSCQRPQPDWASACADVRVRGAGWGREAGDEAVRAWLAERLQPWRVEAPDGQATGLLTGYFEPLVEGSRRAQGPYQYPLYRPPVDLGQRKPHYTRAEYDTLPQAQAALAGRELVYLADPLDALLAQVQGSTRVRLVDETTPQGVPRTVRLAFAGHNDQPYQSVGRWLVDQGAFSLEQASWPAIRGWALLNPQRVPEMMRANPRVVFFREEPLADPAQGPVGAQGVPLTPGRSIAVDREAIPYGTPAWLDSTEPQPWSPAAPAPRPLQRLVVAQDTGGAIVGAVRADYFWGWGEEALAQAGRTRQPLRLWVLWPRGQGPQPR